MTSKLVLGILNRAGFENISAFEMKTIAAVLTQKGIGTVICPKCIVRDGIFQCRCGFTSNILNCACDVCGQQLLDNDRWGNFRQYIKGHNSRGDKNQGWKGGYWSILKPALEPNLSSISDPFIVHDISLGHTSIAISGQMLTRYS